MFGLLLNSQLRTFLLNFKCVTVQHPPPIKTHEQLRTVSFIFPFLSDLSFSLHVIISVYAFRLKNIFC